MPKLERLPRFVWRLFRFLPPRIAYSIGLGSLAGRAVLLLTTIGRKTGRPRVTALLYDQIDGTIYVASARGTEADWYRNVLANPNVEVSIGSRQFKGRAEPITDLSEIVGFLERRLQLHPRVAGAVFRLAGLGGSPSREQLREYAKKRGLVAIRPEGSSPESRIVRVSSREG